MSRFGPALGVLPLVFIALVSGVMVLFASPDRVSSEAYLIGRATAAICFTVSVAALSVIRSLGRRDGLPRDPR